MGLLEVVLRFVLGNLEIAPFVVYPGDGRCVSLEPGGETSYTGTVLRIPPVVHAANEFGYRGAARPEQRDPSRLRVIGLGDSFTFGQGVEAEQALPAALEAELQTRGVPSVEVLNFGVPGLNLRESIDQYRYFARRWQPEVVVLFLFRNDLDAPLCDIVSRTTFTWWVRNVRLFRLGVIALAPETFGTPTSGSTPARVAQLRDELAELRNEVARDGARLLVVALANPLDDAEQMRDIAAALEVPAMVFEREAFYEYPKIPNEFHWTPAANRTAAAEVADWMAGQLRPGDSGVPGDH